MKLSQAPNKTQPAIANLTQKERGVMLGTLLKELLPEQLGLSLRPVDSLARLICWMLSTFDTNKSDQFANEWNS